MRNRRRPPEEWTSVTVPYLHELYATIKEQRGEIAACKAVLAEFGYDWDSRRLPEAPTDVPLR